MARSINKTIGWFQLIAGLVALWSVWAQNFIVGIAVIGLALLATGYIHITEKH